MTLEDALKGNRFQSNHAWPPMHRECCQMIAEHLDDQTNTAGNWNGNASMTWPYREVCRAAKWRGQ